MRLRTVIISWELLRDLFTAGPHPPHSYDVIRDAIPADAELVNVRHAWPNRIEIVLHSPQFADVPLGSAGEPVIRGERKVIWLDNDFFGQPRGASASGNIRWLFQNQFPQGINAAADGRSRGSHCQHGLSQRRHEGAPHLHRLG